MKVRPTVGGLTLVLLLVAGVGIYLVDRHQKSTEVEQADAAALRYSQALAAYQDEAHHDLVLLAASGEPGALAETATRLRDELPRPAEVGSYGAEHSSAYRAALDRRAALEERFGVAVDVLGEWASAAPFVAAVEEALDADIPQSVVGGPVASGDPVRTELVPLMQQVKAQFESVPVPARQEQLAAGVSAALQHVIDEATRAAQQLDAGRAASFTYGAEYRDALQPVVEYEAQLRSRMEAAIAGLAPLGGGGGGNEPPAPDDAPGDNV
ncbi:hypothetical protein D9V41_03845 [Aeromicrobium phragmitis]|uniref:Uncharacterized protein n=1 Tax=Aeromicrobium phragmitis TaxID=2478914 RepID=A0A3L8PNJ9_9ACTN|nr:hypothetical protein [Aeromicrobium phragmitis]RLV56911.1 hypothetical protein D9V41_03845 [Aeromicrobium phragmitis]